MNLPCEAGTSVYLAPCPPPALHKSNEGTTGR